MKRTTLGKSIKKLEKYATLSSVAPSLYCFSGTKKRFLNILHLFDFHRETEAYFLSEGGSTIKPPPFMGDIYVFTCSLTIVINNCMF